MCSNCYAGTDVMLTDVLVPEVLVTDVRVADVLVTDVRVADLLYLMRE
jgi:hypothetical protein